MEMNEFMMPQTVPKRPMKGATDPVVARKVREASRDVSSLFFERRRARSTFSVSPPAGASPEAIRASST